MLQDVQPQHALQVDRWAAIAGLGIKRLDQRTEFAPWHDLIHLGQELRPTGLLAVLVEAYVCQGQLPHLSQLRRCSYPPTDRSVAVSRTACSEVP